MLLLKRSWAFPKDAYLFISRRAVCRTRPVPLHTHDFPEVFWIEEGTGTHVINGERTCVRRGDLVTMRAADRHSFHATNDRGFPVLNISFPIETLDFLRDRYFPTETRFYWSTAELPFRTVLNSRQLRWLKEWSDHLWQAPKTRIEVERFLLDLLYELAEHCPEKRADSAPPWLVASLDKIRSPEHFATGTRGLAQLAGRCPEHVTRQLKKHFHLTATEVVNQARMEYAAQQLNMTEKEIVQIALECGFENLGHFYQVFRKQFGTTPNQYRLRHKATMP